MNWEKGWMQAQRKDSRRDAIPAMIAMIVAILGMAGILFEDFDPGNGSLDSGNARTTTAVSRAGSIEIPSGPPAGQSASQAR
jgi:hypothetical protein